MSCEKAPPTYNNTNTENAPQFIGSKGINRSKLVTVGKRTQKPTDQITPLLLTLWRALPYNEGPFLNQDSLQNKMPPTESKQEGEKSVPEQTRSIANLKLKSERKQNMQPALRNCQQETLGCRLLLLNRAIIEAKEQKSPSHEAKTLASKGGGHCATGLLHPILCNSILKPGGRKEITWQPVMTEIIISRFRDRCGIKIIFSFGGCQGTWPTIPH